MKKTILTLSLFIPLISCTMLSKDIHPLLNYREKPIIKIIEYDSFLKLQADCFELAKIPGIYGGCTFIPFDPTQECVIRVMRGDKQTLWHEKMHCYGYADTYNPFMAQSNPFIQPNQSISTDNE